MEKALIAMSGGVDSSVAAKLVLDKGYEGIGCTMKLYDGLCCGADDTEDARNVAYKLGMTFYAFNFREEFREKVINNFVGCYLCGKTPNPCIECNRFLKFGKLFDRAKILGCDYIVTGHYARIGERDGEKVLLKALDPAKDQSYVLYMLSQEQLRHIMFPIGDLEKSEVRRIAEENGFVNADKPDSQDICFVPDGDYARVVGEYLEGDQKPGNFVTLDGKVLGTHKGIIHYTVGQRRGLGISAEAPLYVHHIDVERNEVVLSDNGSLFGRTVKVPELSFTTDRQLPESFRCSAKIRYHHKEQPGVLERCGKGGLFTFDEPQRAITPGQSLVLYDGDRVLGGGIIEI